ncbi:hypothetical protein K438DRAFT_1771139 [Mycena galopus ATCC 62051]|nr:hypothetical protein K438DRAFT_1771139 [Mycena galopus ATCC 62051]
MLKLESHCLRTREKIPTFISDMMNSTIPCRNFALMLISEFWLPFNFKGGTAPYTVKTRKITHRAVRATWVIDEVNSDGTSRVNDYIVYLIDEVIGGITVHTGDGVAASPTIWPAVPILQQWVPHSPREFFTGRTRSDAPSARNGSAQDAPVDYNHKDFWCITHRH